MAGYRRLDIDVHFKPCPEDLQLIDQSQRVDFGYRRLYPACMVTGGRPLCMAAHPIVNGWIFTSIFNLPRDLQLIGQSQRAEFGF